MTASSHTFAGALSAHDIGQHIIVTEGTSSIEGTLIALLVTGHAAAQPLITLTVAAFATHHDVNVRLNTKVKVILA